VADDFETLVSEVEHRRRAGRRLRHIFLIGIDGRGGSGKSTLARELAERLDDVTIVECDDFYFPSTQRLTRPRPGGEEAGDNSRPS
jgi:pantothenate kinase-related protein Tda10